MIDDDILARLASVAARPERSWTLFDLTRLAPLFDALSLRDANAPEEVLALTRGLAAILDEESAHALSEDAKSTSEIAERVARMTELVAANDALLAARRR